MQILNTIQKVEKLNNIVANRTMDIVGGASHHYVVIEHNDNDSMDGEIVTKIDFQCGPRNESESKHGVLDTDLLEIVRDRLKGFQSGDFATDDNQKALEHIEIALMYLNKRVMDRYERKVLGTYNK